MSFARRTTASTTALLAVAALAACSGSPAEPGQDPTAGDGGVTTSTELTVVTHDSFALPDELKEAFEEASGYDVTYVAPGDGGALVNQLILTKDSPLGDVVFGVDNTFARRAVDEGVFSPYTSATLPASAEQYAIESLTPVDMGDVCINADTQWFADAGIDVPTTLEDLTDPAYADLLVVSHPASSSPGLAFLAATVGAEGEGWLEYWDALVANGVKVVPGWSEAYYTEFSGADGEGPYPLVLSYATSPAFTLTEDGSASTTEALLETCFRQVEYAGVIAGAENEQGAQEFIDFLLSAEVQAAIPEQMYMYPIDDEVELPADWASFAPLSEAPIEVPAEEIAANRDQWISDWTARVIG
ncbi:thiamine ABC transporter substrate-binding protein [Tessaracoccus terricola]